MRRGISGHVARKISFFLGVYAEWQSSPGGSSKVEKYSYYNYKLFIGWWWTGDHHGPVSVTRRSAGRDPNAPSVLRGSPAATASSPGRVLLRWGETAGGSRYSAAVIHGTLAAISLFFFGLVNGRKKVIPPVSRYHNSTRKEGAQ